jgi:hypothetical protein
MQVVAVTGHNIYIHIHIHIHIYIYIYIYIVFIYMYMYMYMCMYMYMYTLYVQYSFILHYSELDADDMEEADVEVTLRD